MKYPQPLLLFICALGFGGQQLLAVDDFELPPIRYSESQPSNCVAELQRRIEQKEIELRRDEKMGYLLSLLSELSIPHESQLLVFSKTSMQSHRISPRTPRAIYFNDDTYVGYCHNGDVIEVAAADEQLGSVFYTIDQEKDSPAVLVRQTHACLQCHSTTPAGTIPGLLARSLFVSRTGMPILSEGGYRVNHTTPIENRWGGWYVTGTHGGQSHLGNFVVENRKATRPFQNTEGLNVVDLSGRIATNNYLTMHSDIVALMVFEHQLHIHNLLTACSFEARRAHFYEAEFNRALGEPEGTRLESTYRRIKAAGDQLIAGLLFANEAPITAPISGSSEFATIFATKGPRDSQGRSLRDLDLKTRIFRYPCSYLIYSPMFDALPKELKDYISTQLREILTANEAPTFGHLSSHDRRAIFEILDETKPDLWPD